MFQQRPFFVRCALACLVALSGLFVVIGLSIEMPSPIVSAATDDRPAAITLTGSITLAPDDGSFVEVSSTNLPGVQNGFAIWGDCNNDEALDVMLAGQVSATLKIARAYQRQAGSGFAQTSAFTDVIYGAAAWGDYDNDGWLDLVVTGENAGVPISRLYHNLRSGCTFSAVAANLIGVRHSTVAWGDYDADGQLDLLLAGDDGSQPVTKIYHNQHGSFSDSGLVLPGIQHGSAVWGDYNSDGLADLLLTGSITGGLPLTKLYRSDGHGALVEISTTLPALSGSAAAWGDYDNDGYLDLLLEGTTAASAHIAGIYRNVQGTFVTPTLLVGSSSWTSAAWGDYDTDGYLDALVATSGYAKAYRNEITGTFAAGIDVGSPLQAGTATWGDYDHNGNLDVMLTGQDFMASPLTKIYRYTNLPSSAPPQAPLSLTTVISGSVAILHWSPPASDDHTPTTGLSYNLRVGTRPGGEDIIAPMAIGSTGHRLLPALGNVYQSHVFTLSNLEMGQRYYWSVQAIDTSFLGSTFAEEESFQPSRVFLPVIQKDFFIYYTTENETEPNDTASQANGPLQSGRVYHGLHDDERDFYSVYLADTEALTNSLNVDMLSLNGGTQIQLFYQIVDVPHRVGYAVTPPYHISYIGSSGWYYIYVYTNPAFAISDTYTLTVTYP